MGKKDQPTGLRVVTFNVLPVAYELVAKWAARHGHRIVLIVTTPGPPARRSTSYRGVVAQAPPETDILITTRPRRVALPLIRALEPDLIISGSFPYRIPQEIVATARYGAMNTHPAPLPAYRGPNPTRLVYERVPAHGRDAAPHRRGVRRRADPQQADRPAACVGDAGIGHGDAGVADRWGDRGRDGAGGGGGSRHAAG